MWFLNCVLLMIGATAAVFGISFFLRNKESTGNIRLYIFSYGICSAIWCISYGLIGLCDNFELCANIRKLAIFSIDLFLVTEVFLVTEMCGIKPRTSKLARIYAIILSIIDFLFYSQTGVDMYIRKSNYTTWKANPDFSLARNIQSAYIGLIWVLLFSLGIVWIIKNQKRRQKRFLTMVFISNFILLFFTLPDTFLPNFGITAIPTSGIGAAACAIVMWYGAIKLNSFDIRMGNIRDTIFDFLEVGIIIFDMNQDVAVVNRYSRQFVGENEDKAYQLYDLFNIDKDEADDFFNKALDDIYSVRLWDKSESKAYSVKMSAARDDFNEPFCFMCVFVDITEEVEAVKKFEIANLAKSRFLAQMSHEIRTPINAVLGMNEMILRESEDKDILEYSENIDSAGNTLLTLINSILDFSKIEDGKMDIIPVKYDTASFINDIVNSVLQRAESKGLAFN
ncbi:MAG: hypothetical protein K6F00_08365, partial [Lachnospiraceae bacterium]|nr:hypothetical protein [Lachnospiraceae bacterium]